MFGHMVLCPAENLKIKLQVRAPPFFFFFITIKPRFE